MRNAGNILLAAKTCCCIAGIIRRVIDDARFAIIIMKGKGVQEKRPLNSYCSVAGLYVIITVKVSASFFHYYSCHKRIIAT